MRGRFERIALCTSALLLLASVTGAQETGAAAKSGSRKPIDQNDLFQSLSLGSRNEPIRINSDSLELDYKGSTLTYRGNVQVIQGDVTLNSDRLSIAYHREALGGGPESAQAGTGSSRGGADKIADKIKEVVAEGHVRIRRGDRLAEGRRAVFDQAKQTIVLSDGAVLHEGPNQVAGDRIVVYLQEERSVVEGGSNSRVKAVFYPGTSPAVDVASGAGTGPPSERDSLKPGAGSEREPHE